MEKKDEKFDLYKEPTLIKWYYKPLVMLVSFFISGPFAAHSKIIKHNFKDFKEPALILSNHGSAVDFSNMAYATWPHLPCYVAAIDEFLGREWMMRAVGCIPKRKFTTDLSLIKRINKIINKDKSSVVIYPEARFSLAGINEDIGDTLGKLCKLCKCRVIIMNQKGNFIRSPQWNKHPYSKVRPIADLYEIVSAEEAKTLNAEEIQERIEKAFSYDDYKWQNDNHIKIKNKKRAQNLHQILYKCPICKKEGFMEGKGINITCNHCHSKWTLDEYGELILENGKSPFKLVSDWYRWEKEEVIKEVNEGTYHFIDDVRIEKLINSKVKFQNIGTVKLIHDINGFHLKGTLANNEEFSLEKPPLANRSIHIEYDYKKHGNCLDISTIDDTWFAYPLTKGNLITKFNFATEAIYFKNKTK